MLYFDRIDFSQGLVFSKTNASKECVTIGISEMIFK